MDVDGQSIHHRYLSKYFFLIILYFNFIFLRWMLTDSRFITAVISGKVI